jgi:hypothetical protein
MKKAKKGKLSGKHGKKKDVLLYNKGDCVAVKGDNKTIDIVVINQNVKSTETAIKTLPMKRIDKNYYLTPKDEDKEAWVIVRKIIGCVSLEPTENKRCFMLSEKEGSRIQKGKDLEPEGEVNMNKIR